MYFKSQSAMPVKHTKSPNKIDQIRRCSTLCSCTTTIEGNHFSHARVRILKLCVMSTRYQCNTSLHNKSVNLTLVRKLASSSWGLRTINNRYALLLKIKTTLSKICKRKLISSTILPHTSTTWTSSWGTRAWICLKKKAQINCRWIPVRQLAR